MFIKIKLISKEEIEEIDNQTWISLHVHGVLGIQHFHSVLLACLYKPEKKKFFRKHSPRRGKTSLCFNEAEWAELFFKFKKQHTIHDVPKQQEKYNFTIRSTGWHFTAAKQTFNTICYKLNKFDEKKSPQETQLYRENPALVLLKLFFSGNK